MPSRRLLVIVFVFLVALATAPLRAQNTPGSVNADRADTLTKMTALRDTFVARLKSAGFTCTTMAPPKISVEHIPSFGQYDDATDTLRTSDWTLLGPQEKAFFASLAGPDATEDSTRQAFEKAAHGWIFIHEMGHWWQHCRGYISTHTHYQVEYGANRISLAYWREADPSVVQLLMGMFQAVLAHSASPVPDGQSVEDYFNQNYETLGPGPAYPWFQSRMGATLKQETPPPTLNQVLASVKP